MTFFSIQSVITKVEIIPFSVGLYLWFDPFVEEKRKRMMGHPLIVRLPFFFCQFSLTFFSVNRVDIFWQYSLIAKEANDVTFFPYNR